MDRDFLRHVAWWCKNHYPTKSLQQVTAAVAGMDERHLLGTEGHEALVHLVLDGCGAKPGPERVRLADVLVVEAVRNCRLEAKLRGLVATTPVASFGYPLGEPDLFRAKAGK